MRSIFDYLFSIHYTLGALSVVAASVTLGLKCDWRISILILCLGAICTCVVFYLQPLKCFAPTGGRFNVGVREIVGEYGGMKPPITIIYPTRSGVPFGGIDYIPFGESGYLQGLAKYSKIPYLLLKDLFLLRRKMRVDAPPVPLIQRNGAICPLVVFSHGLAGFPHLYSTLLMNLAARGAVVFAVTHMDGSAAFCRDAGPVIRIPLNTKVKWTCEDRAPQLDIRIRETLNTVKRIRNGELLIAMGYDQETVKKCIDAQPLIHLVGHSFGGSTCLAAALIDTETAKEKGELCTIGSTVVYDPWMIPLEKKYFYSKLTNWKSPSHFITPTLQILSEEWMRNEEESALFFAVKAVVDQQERTEEEAAIVTAANAKLKSTKTSWYTLKNYRRSGHLFCTDVPLFNPVLGRADYVKASPKSTITGLAVETMQFLDKISGPLPLDTNLLKDPVLAAALRA